MVLFILTIILLLYDCPLKIASADEEITKTLYGYNEFPAGNGKTRSFLFDAPNTEFSSENGIRPKREITQPSAPGSGSTAAEYTKINHLNDTHKQLMVHWVGEGSNVLICLARDPTPTTTNVPLSASSVYISYDYGNSFENKTSFFKMDNGNYSSIEKFYNHPKYNTHFVFTDLQNKHIFVTSNYGRNITKIKLSFTPSDISFHEFHSQIIVALDKEDPKNKLWVTDDFGQTWRVLQQYVKFFFWLQDEHNEPQLVLQREEPNELSTILYLGKPLINKPFSIYASDVKDIFVKGDYIFYTMKNKKHSYDLYVSYKFGKIVACIFDTDFDLKGYHIVDVSNNRALVAVNHNTNLSNLYVSEDLKKSTEKVQFILSLESVLCHFPKSTWKDSWLHHISEEAFADVYKVEGLTGIYIASQVFLKPSSNNLGPQHLASRITFDHGATWKSIQPPQKDIEGQLISCSPDNGCSLHLSQRFSQLYPDTRSISILSSKSAPGVIVATGVIGKSLKGHFAVYISTDAGVTWRQSLRDLYFFNMGDHGGILTAVKYLKMRGEVKHILYSTDEGESWTESAFHNEEIRLYGLMTEPGENTTIFTMFGSLPEQHQWLIVKIDLKNVFKYNCTEEDYKFWSPSQRNENQHYVPCVLGQQKVYKRRIPHANCYNGLDFDQPISMLPCECDSLDYECDFGFTRAEHSGHCIRNRSVNHDPYKIPFNCSVGLTYNRTKGYRKISEDVCINGLEKQYLPDIIHCPAKLIPNILIFAQRDKIIRMNLATQAQETLQIPNLKNVIAIDFDLKNECVYWADIVTDTIGRLCEDGVTPIETLVSNDLVSVEGMALDWLSQNLYFVDGLRAKIELIKTNVEHPARMRRVILGSAALNKPRGIAVHPMAGYMFWTDWDSKNPSVKRADLNGSNIITIANKSLVEWPNGITIDYIAERVYWVDAREDYIGSTDLHGRGFKKVSIPAEYVSHPFAVAVFKDDLFWDDWKRNSIFISNKDLGGNVGTLVNNITGLMDLKVIAHGAQEGTNACVNTTCTHICVPSPSPPHFHCLCPVGMENIKGSCLCPGGVLPFTNMTCPKIVGTCSPEHFECGTGVCVPKNWRCDNEDDCGDNSDEQHCENQTCAPNYLVCSDGKCLPHYWRCDYEADCSDGSDEANCPKQNCTSDQFTCSNGRCISLKWKCDGEDDCRDNSDEKDCVGPEPTTCKPDEFQCTTGGEKCIPLSWRCDGEKDCRDNSDEAACSNNTCMDIQFSCGLPSNRCIYSSWVCDGEKDCDNGLDEVNCTNVATSTSLPPASNPFEPMNGSVCQEWMFTCANKKCIPLWWKCDKAIDCEDGSDELGCGENPTTSLPEIIPTTTNVCGRNQFQCATGECISMAWVCDTSKDCSGGEDEANCNDAFTCNPSNQFKCKMDGSCISINDVCNNKKDCPDGSDEAFCNKYPDPATPSCLRGHFPCDVNKCLPLAKICDGTPNCHDGSDEVNCTSTSRIYQVLQMGVDERNINDTSLLLYWWIPIPDKIKLEFMPSISKVTNGIWKNETWTEHSECRFDNLEPFTRYNLTIYVRIKGNNNVFPPARYYDATTAEGKPSEPWNVTVVQRNGSDVLISWNEPLKKNGIIQSYEICWMPPLIKMQLSDNSTAHVLTADFQPNIKYSFYVIAYNHRLHSERSDVKTMVFDGDSDLGEMKSLTVVDSTNNSVSLSWVYSKPVDGFIVAIEAEKNYPNVPARITFTSSITITGLSPGTRFSYKVSAFKKLLKGAETTITTKTTGIPLPEVQIGQAEVVKSIGTSVKVTWNRPKDSRKENWVYGVYYGLSEAETTKGARVNTTDLSTTVQNLDACEQYIFMIGIVGPLGVGPLPGNFNSVTTFLNHKAPPKKLIVQKVENNDVQMSVNWSPSCPNMEEPIGYILNIFEKTLSISRNIKVQKSREQELSRIFNITYGAVYEIKVSTSVEGAIFTSPVIFKAPPIPPPYEVSGYSESNGSFIIFWQERSIASNIGGYHYEILLSEGDELNENTAKRFVVDKPPFICNNMSLSRYTFAIRIKTDNGYKSELSEVSSHLNRAASWRETINKSNLTSILIPVCLLLCILGGALAFYMIKYRRLQNSFTRFANSHYDTRSEAATFDDNALEEDDSPQIRGFSDDEPLVIA